MQSVETESEIQEYLTSLQQHLPQDQQSQVQEILKGYIPILTQREGAPKIIARLRHDFTPKQVATATSEQRVWETIGLFYLNSGRPHQAAEVFLALYEQMINFQQEKDERVHKGMPLIWLRDLHLSLGHKVIAKRYAMLTLCEDSIRDYTKHNKIDAEEGGTYFRLAYGHGMPDSEIRQHAEKIYNLHLANPVPSRFPEWILQELGNQWMIEYPTEQEAFVYEPNRRYIKYLFDDLGEGTGNTLERLAQYILDIVPGFRTYRRQIAKSDTDYDVVCAVEGSSSDFRSELGRYFLCECKDWNRPADVTTILKFAQILRSTQCRTGIIFAEKGFSGGGKTENAERYQLMIAQSDKTIILVVDQTDLESLTKEANFITMLRSKYEKVRLDLRNT